MTQLATDRLTVQVQGKTILETITAQVPEGGVTALIGPNGAGKSTLLRALTGAGLVAVTGGTVTAALPRGATALTALTRQERAQLIAWIPDGIDCPFTFTVLETVVMGRFAWHQGAPRSHDQDRAHSALAQMQLSHLAHRSLTSLSRGERQKAMVARALASDAQCLLLDEPCANLDVASALALMELLTAVAQSGRAVAISVHDVALAQRYATWGICLNHGKLVATGAAKDVFTLPLLSEVFAVRALTVHGPLGQDWLAFEPRD